MATTFAVVGDRKVWAGGTGNDYIVGIARNYPPRESNLGQPVQLEIASTPALNLSTITIEIEGVIPGSWTPVDLTDNTTNKALIGRDWLMARLRISNVPTGSYTISVINPKIQR